MSDTFFAVVLGGNTDRVKQEYNFRKLGGEVIEDFGKGKIILATHTDGAAERMDIFLGNHQMMGNAVEKYINCGCQKPDQTFHLFL